MKPHKAEEVGNKIFDTECVLFGKRMNLTHILTPRKYFLDIGYVETKLFLAQEFFSCRKKK